MKGDKAIQDSMLKAEEVMLGIIAEVNSR